MTAIFKREVKSYFTGMIGWVIAAVSLFFLGLYYTNRNLLYASSDFASVLYTMTMILLFLLPAISMRSFAEERKNKTDQLLLTARSVSRPSWRANFWPRSPCSPSRWRRRCSCR